jgi:hypothetical protein
LFVILSPLFVILSEAKDLQNGQDQKTKPRMP